jgi:hypothetical protein
MNPGICHGSGGQGKGLFLMSPGMLRGDEVGFCIPSNIPLTSLLEETKEAVAKRYHIQASKKKKNTKTISLKAKVQESDVSHEALHAAAPNSDAATPNSDFRYPETLALMDHEEVVGLFAMALSSKFKPYWPGDDKAKAFSILQQL